MAKKTSRVRRTFTPQFKKDAVALIRGGRSVTEVAHDLGIAQSLLQRWREQLEREAEDAFPGTASAASGGWAARPGGRKPLELRPVPGSQAPTRAATPRSRPRWSRQSRRRPHSCLLAGRQQAPG
jgi:transposase-like protein